jgi:hypothetical protein
MLNFKLAFLSHLPLQPSGGGLYSVTYNVHLQLQRCFPSLTFCKVVPRIGAFDAIRSKLLRRVLHRPGAFYQFSKQNLRATAQKVSKTLPSGIDAVFFRSSTRWIGCRPTVPYFVHT